MHVPSPIQVLFADMQNLNYISLSFFQMKSSMILI